MKDIIDLIGAARSNLRRHDRPPTSFAAGEVIRDEIKRRCAPHLHFMELTQEEKDKPVPKLFGMPFVFNGKMPEDEIWFYQGEEKVLILKLTGPQTDNPDKNGRTP